MIPGTPLLHANGLHGSSRGAGGTLRLVVDVKASEPNPPKFQFPQFT